MKKADNANTAAAATRPVTIAELAAMKAAGEKIACLTAYDASFAALEDRAGVDLVLVGDSLGMVVQGRPTTVSVSVDDMVYHSRITAAGLRRAFVMADLPFMSYASVDDACHNARRLMGEGGAQMVKLEGGVALADTITRLADHGVPVCAHLGLKPQLVHKMGGFKVQGRHEAAAESMRREARVLEDAGADLLLLECVPAWLAGEITASAGVPVIGIGAGAETDGQILVVYDILGLSPGKKPRFVQNFMAGNDSLEAAVADYVAAVKSGRYPSAEHTFK